LLSIELYGETIDDEFMDAVRKVGRILEPLRILGKGTAYPEGTVISGRRRRMAAMTLGLKEVPVIVEHGLADKLDIDEQVILSNRPNERTVEQRAREFAKLKDIEAKRAELRMKQQSRQKSLETKDKSDAPANLPEHQGEAAVIAAEAVGMSRHTAERAAAVVERIDKLESNGHAKEAGELREKLETSVSAAHREIAPPKKKQPKKPLGVDKGQLVRTMKTLMSQVVKCLDARGKDGNHAKCNKALNDFIRAWEEWN
jgi:ParB-like chromosome segregation protein Spo0J